MTRINTNISSMVAVNTLNKNNSMLQTSLQRLSTGFRINSGKDDPAGLIASQTLGSEQASTRAGIANAQRADNIMSTAEGALGEVSNLLTSLQGLVGNSANSGGLSQQEKDANQLQVDSILSTINRIANATSFSGVKLLNGGMDYTTSGLASTSAFTNISINNAKVGSATLAVKISVVTSAQSARLDAALAATGIVSATTLSISGAKGSIQLSFAKNATASAIAASINQFSDSTGVAASATTANTTLTILSSDYGASKFVSVNSTSNTAFTTTHSGVVTTTSTGRDAALTVNGTGVTSDGLNVSANLGDSLSVAFTLNKTMNVDGLSKTFGITGGGATFSIGPTVDASNLASVGLARVDSTSIGKTTDSSGNLVSLYNLGSGGSAAVNTGDTALAQKIVDQAVKDVASMRGRIGAFQTNVLSSMTNSLNVALENVSASLSAIRDTDFASETSNLTRSQILTQAATSVLSQANASPQSVLKLLG